MLNQNTELPEKKNLLRNLILRLELFTSFIPIPTYVYFVMVTGAVETDDQLFWIAMMGLFAGGYTVVWGVWHHWFSINKIYEKMKTLSDTQLPQSEKKEVKKYILNYPRRARAMILYRWIIGAFTGIAGFAIFTYSMPMRLLFTAMYGLVFVLPISYVMYFFFTKSIIRPLLQLPELAVLQIPQSEIKETKYLTLMLISIASVTITPIAIFGYIIFSLVSGGMQLNYPVLHISLLSSGAFAAILVVSYTIASGVRKNINDTNNSLLSIGEGNFTQILGRSTNDEFGRQADLLYAVSGKLEKMYREITELNENLEAKVKERTRELNESLEETNRLKQQQDGDYFLTSLLMRPLNKIYVQSENISVESMLKQKKKFEFRKKSHEIGGDLCSAHSIMLRGKKYVSFINADAMGKSIQGAGGALVLGAVYYSIIERTRLSRDMHSQSPERWLKNAFLELHKVFEGFDGSMLVSLVIGLMDDETGFLYYINAEHPWSILYRDKQASFIERELFLRKLGMTAVSGKIFIQTFEMQPGDTLICGSDGRDDIIIQNGTERVMSEDENLILEKVSAADGDLQRIYDEVEKTGEISDDFSLLKVTYMGQSVDDHIHHAHEARVQYKNKNYADAALVGERYFENRPHDNNFMKFLIRAHKLAGNYNVALDLAERLRLRTPDDAGNLIMLSNIQRLLKNYDRAKEIFIEAETLDPEHPKLIHLKTLLDKN